MSKTTRTVLFVAMGWALILAASTAVAPTVQPTTAAVVEMPTALHGWEVLTTFRP